MAVPRRPVAEGVPVVSESAVVPVEEPVAEMVPESVPGSVPSWGGVVLAPVPWFAAPPAPESVFEPEPVPVEIPDLEPEPEPEPESDSDRGDVPVRVSEHLTDAGNAARFTRLHHARVRYCASTRQWLVWDGTRWRRDDREYVFHLSLDVADDIRAEADRLPAKQAERYRAYALVCESTFRRQSLLTAARSTPGLSVSAADLDGDPWTLVVRNGTLDLRTGALRPSDPQDFATRQAAVTFDPDAACPMWEAHIATVTQGDVAMGEYLRRLAGYTLTGSTAEQAFFTLEGNGANGKNVFVETLMHLLGDYAGTASSTLLTASTGTDHPTILADLAGKRMVFVDEIPQKKHLDVERVKTLTGSARIKARYMHQDFFEYPAQLKLWITGNDRPRIKDASDGIWRRMRRILFHAKIPDQQKIPDYARILYTREAPGILNWALAGLADWQRSGTLGDPGSVTDDTREMQHDENDVSVFLTEQCTITGRRSDIIPGAVLYTAYRQWSEEAGIHRADIPTRNAFIRRLTAYPGITRPHDAVSIDGTRHRVLTGLRLTDDEPDGPDAP